VDHEAETKQRRQIKELLDHRERSTKRCEELLKNLSFSDHNTPANNSEDNPFREINNPTVTALFLGLTLNL
jgi:hypothetical protein